MTGLARPPLVRVDDPVQLPVPALGFPVHRRRPSGQGPPAPRLFGRAAWIWSGVVAASVLSLLLGSANLLGPVERLDRMVSGVLARPGTSWADAPARVLETLGRTAGYRLLWIPTVLVLVWYARWRHLAVYLTTLSVVAVAAQAPPATPPHGCRRRRPGRRVPRPRPAHPPIAVQRWSVRRVRLALLTTAAILGAVALLVANLRAGQLL